MYGNYRRYYGMRRARANASSGAPVRADGVDERVVALVAWYREHAVRNADDILDLGCNAAKPLLELCQLLDPPPKRAVGVDIDAKLIEQAKSALRRAWSQRQPHAPQNVEAMHYFPTCFSSLMGQLPMPTPVDTFPTNITFVAENWMQSKGDDRFDLVLCFSLTKWIHLHYGDDGILDFFKRIKSALRSGGILALEIQPWRSYSQARTLSRELRTTHARLRIRPDDFEYILTVLGMTPLGPVSHGAGFGTSFCYSRRFYSLRVRISSPTDKYK